jgi:hypothetical protein
MWYVSVRDQGSSVLQSIIIAAIATGVLYLLLRSKYLSLVWHTLRYSSWMRKGPPGPLKP